MRVLISSQRTLTRTEPGRASLISGCSSVCISGIISKTAWKSLLNNILFINWLIIIYGGGGGGGECRENEREAD